MPTVTGTLKSHLPQNKINAHRFLTQRLRISGYDWAVIRNDTLWLAVLREVLKRCITTVLKSQIAGFDMLPVVLGSEHRFQ